MKAFLSLRRLRRLLRMLLRTLDRALPGIAIVAGLYLLATGALMQVLQVGPAAPVLQVLLVLFTSALLLGQIVKGVRLPKVPPLSPGQKDLADLTSSGALVVATYFLLQGLGGARSPLHPLVYALAAFLFSHHRTRLAVLLFGLMLLCETLLLLPGGLLLHAPQRLLVHAVFLSLFAAMHFLFLRGDLWQRRQEHEARVQGEIRRMQEEACDFRLLSATPGAPFAGRKRAEEEVILAQGAVVVIRQNLRSMIALLRRSLRLHSCVLLWTSQEGEDWKVMEMSSESEDEIVPDMAGDAGVLGTIGKNRLPLNLPLPKPGHLPYYRAGHRRGIGIGPFLGVPVLDGGQLRGVLCADRLPGAEPFTREDESLLESAAEQVLRSLQSERLFCAIERSKYEHERLYSASEKLNRALTPEQVHATAFSAVREICEFDLGAIVSYDRQARRHTVVAVVAAVGKRDDLLGLSFPDNAGLCAMAVKNRHFLPQDGVLREREARMQVFCEDPAGAHIKGMESLLVLPLTCAGEAVGTLVFACQKPGVFTKDKRDMLGVIANQVAGSLENARLYQAMEAMATTDGLTGLTNRRAFQERFAEMLQRAERQGKSLTLLLSDIDHFKKVNDTYGHPVGDVVLKRVAQVVQSCARKIDVAARYGGEEFVVVLEMTDRQGGRQVAERVRQEVQRLSFHSEKGPFQCTLSLGMATFPLDGHDEKTLTAHADQALYHAKHSGRNRAVAYDDLREPQRAAG